MKLARPTLDGRPIVGTKLELLKMIGLVAGATLMGWIGVSDLLWPWSESPRLAAWCGAVSIIVGPLAGFLWLREWFRVVRERRRAETTLPLEIHRPGLRGAR